MTWRSRGYLPHVEGEGAPVMVTYRLADALPAEVLARWQAECGSREVRERVQAYLDRGMGACWLKEPAIAELVENAFRHHEGDRYSLHAWVVMPNHVHVLFTPNEGQSLSTIIKSWKGFTAREANSRLGRRGPFGQPEYFDRSIRNEQHFLRALDYIHQNPVKAGLCGQATAWPYGSARFDTP